MRLHRSSLALAAACLMLAGPAVAQEADPAQDLRDEVSEVAAQIQTKLRPLAEALGVPFPDVQARMDPLIRAAVPAPPAGREDWAFDMAFESKTSVTDNGTAPTEGRRAVFNDAQACIARYPERGPVVHFRRFRQGVLRGHQCVLATVEGDTATLLSETYVEGPDRHMSSRYAAVASVEGDAAATLAAVDPVVETNIELAWAIAELSIAGLPSARVRDDD